MLKRAALLWLLVSCAPPASGSSVLPAAPAPPTPPHAATAPCPPPGAHEEPFGPALVAICHDVFVDASTSEEERGLVKRWYGESLAEMADFFGAAPRETPLVFLCTSDPCVLRFMGPTRRSRAFMTPRPAVAINGIGPLTKGTITHEMVHVEIVRRMGTRRKALPTWFDEGVASFVGDNAPCPPDHKRAIDNLSRLRASYAWEGLTNTPGKMGAAYCQAREEIAAWVELHSRRALLDVIDAVTADRSFDDAYGPLMISPDPAPSLLDGRFALDENADDSGVDSTGRPHIASLLGGATWTTGHRGSGVKVVGGGFVRIDDLVEYGLPDKSFSISLWVKPLTNAHVLIHTAVNASGGDGWCIPLLGHDETGHLVAQVPFADDPRAFLAATGPVLALNKWSHVAVTWRPHEGMTLYVNGSYAASASPKSLAEEHRDAPAAPMHLFVGSDNGARCWTKSIEPGHWNGVVDELHIYNYGLAADRVVADMKAPVLFIESVED